MRRDTAASRATAGLMGPRLRAWQWITGAPEQHPVAFRRPGFHCRDCRRGSGARWPRTLVQVVERGRHADQQKLALAAGIVLGVRAAESGH